MTMPKREQILQLAKELYFNDIAKSGINNFNDPEPNELTESGYTQTARSMLMRDNQKAYVESEYVDFPSEFSVDVLEAMTSGIFISGTTGTGKSDIGMYIADQLMKEGITVIAFDGSQDWRNRSSIPKYQVLTIPYISCIPQYSIVFDISKLSVLQRQSLIESFCEQLYRYQASNMIHRKKYFLIFEEAQSYFKEGFLRAKRFGNSAMLLSEGRNYGVRFMCITQFSALVDKTAMRYMKQRYFGYTSEPRDVEYITTFFPKNKKQEIAETLRNLKAGQFIYMNAEVTTKIEIEPFQTTIAKTQIAIPQLNIEPIKPIQQVNSNGVIELIKLAVFSGIVIYALCQMPKGMI